MKSLEAKIVILGTQGVGKTSLIVRYIGNMFKKTVSPTIGASFFTCKVPIGDYRVKLQVWDTAGQERFRSMAPMYYRKANAAMLVYDITSMDSFHDMKIWVQELKKNIDTSIVMCVIGNKSDLRANRKVDEIEARTYAQSLRASYFETSALSNEGIHDAFCEVGKELIDLYKKGEDSGINVVDSFGMVTGSPAKSSIALDHRTLPPLSDSLQAKTTEPASKGGCC